MESTSYGTISELCGKKTQADSGLYIGHHLTYEHINLTSFSKMKVNLAAQVL